MKLGKHFEGTSEELNNLCENYNFDPSAFLSKPKQFNIHWIWVVSFTLSFVIISLAIWIFPMHADIKKLLIVVDFVLIIINTITVHLKYERIEITSISFIGCCLIMGLCLNVLTPKQALEEFRKQNPTEKKE